MLRGLSNMDMDIWDLLEDHEVGNSNFQDCHLVTLRAGGTMYGMYKQALRELYRRVRGVRELESDRALLIIDTQEHEQALVAMEPGFARQRTEIELRRTALRREECERAIADTYRELAVFYAQAQGLKEQVGVLTAERRWNYERELWEYRVREMAALDIGSGQRHLSPQTIEHLNALPKEDREKILADLKDDKLLQKHNQVVEEREQIIRQLEIPDEKIFQLPRIADALGQNSPGLPPKK